MSRNLLNFVIDLLTAAAMAGMIATGLIIRFALPPGSGNWRVLWGLGRHDWGDVHFWLALGVGIALLVHIALHWQWVCTTALRLCGRGLAAPSQPRRLARNLSGVALITSAIGAFAAFVWVARSHVAEVGIAAGRGGPVSRQQALPDLDADSRSVGEETIRGSMTLGEAASALGMPVDVLRANLGLPASVSADERLGRLRQQYGFSMSQVRDARLASVPSRSKE